MRPTGPRSHYQVSQNPRGSLGRNLPWQGARWSDFRCSGRRMRAERSHDSRTPCTAAHSSFGANGLKVPGGQDWVLLLARYREHGCLSAKAQEPLRELYSFPGATGTRWLQTPEIHPLAVQEARHLNSSFSSRVLLGLPAVPGCLWLHRADVRLGAHTAFLPRRLLQVSMPNLPSSFKDTSHCM